MTCNLGCRYVKFPNNLAVKIFISLVLAIFLSGCFESSQDFYKNETSFIPIQTPIGVSKASSISNERIALASRHQNSYVLQSFSYVKAALFHLKGQKNYFVLQLEQDSSSKYKYRYILVKFFEGGWLSSRKLYLVDFDKALAIKRAGTGSLINDSLNSREQLEKIFNAAIEIGKLSEDEYKIFDLNDRDEKKSFSDIVNKADLTKVIDLDRDPIVVHEARIAAEKKLIAPTPGGAWADLKKDLQDILDGKPFGPTEKNVPFLAGFGLELVERCGLPRNASDRATVVRFGTQVTFQAMFATPNVGLGATIQVRLNMEAGVTLAKTLDCSSKVASELSSGLVKHIRNSSR